MNLKFKSVKDTWFIDRGLKFVLIAGLIWRVLNCFIHPPTEWLESDPGRHWVAAKTFLNPSYFAGYDAIGYQLYLFLVQKITGSYEPLIALSNALLSVGTVLTFYRGARVWKLDAKLSLAFAAAFAWTPSLVAIFQYTMVETLLLFLSGCSLWVSGRAYYSGKHWGFLLAIGFWMATLLTKTTVAPLAGGFVIFYLWKYRMQAIKQVPLSMLLCIMMVLPNYIRSKKILGFPAPFGVTWLLKVQRDSNTKHIEFYKQGGRWVFSSPACYQQPLAPFSNWMLDRSKEESKVVIHLNSGDDLKDWKMAYASIDLKFRDRIEIYGENLILLFFDPTWPDGDTSKLTGMLNYWFRWMWFPLVFYIIGGLYDQLQTKTGLAPLVVITCLGILAMALQPVVLMEGRYRKPIEPFILLSAFFVLQSDRLIRKNKESS